MLSKRKAAIYFIIRTSNNNETLIVFCFCSCYAFAYISVGLFMATTEKWRNLSVSQLWAIFIIGFIYCYIDTSSVSIGNQPIAFAIVALCMKWNINSKSLFFSYCRNMSTYIYLVHIFGIQWASKIGNNSIEIWIYSLLISISLATLISIIKQSKLYSNALIK